MRHDISADNDCTAVAHRRKLSANKREELYLRLRRASASWNSDHRFVV